MRFLPFTTITRISLSYRFASVEIVSSLELVRATMQHAILAILIPSGSTTVNLAAEEAREEWPSLQGWLLWAVGLVGNSIFHVEIETRFVFPKLVGNSALDALETMSMACGSASAEFQAVHSAP